MEELQYTMVPVADLRPDPDNPRKHPEKQIKQIMASIEEHGFLSPLLIDEHNVVIAGHGRLEAAKRLGRESVPCLIESHLTEAQRISYMIADNRLAELSSWDKPLVGTGLAKIAALGADVTLTGFGKKSLPAPVMTSGSTDPDDVPLAPAEPKAKRGQIWQLGAHRLMCGDSTQTADFDRLMDGRLADLVFTDPPYGVAIGSKNEALNEIQRAGRCTENIEGDTLSEAELRKVLVAAMSNIREHCKDDASYYVTSPQGGSLGLMMMMMKDAGLEVRHMLIWKKNCATFSIGRLDYDYQHEPIFYTWTKSHHNYRCGEYRTTIWEYDKPRKCDLHPTMKPVALIVNAILDGTVEGDAVLDGFGGSGSTMIACEQTSRRCYMMELDPHCCDVIIRRWEDFTGKKAVLVDE